MNLRNSNQDRPISFQTSSVKFVCSRCLSQSGYKKRLRWLKLKPMALFTEELFIETEFDDFEKILWYL